MHTPMNEKKVIIINNRKIATIFNLLPITWTVGLLLYMLRFKTSSLSQRQRNSIVYLCSDCCVLTHNFVVHIQSQSRIDWRTFIYILILLLLFSFFFFLNKKKKKKHFFQCIIHCVFVFWFAFEYKYI